jgi:hypothetical protein
LSNLIIKKSNTQPQGEREEQLLIGSTSNQEVTSKGISTSTKLPKEGSGDLPKGFQIAT